MDLKLLSVVNSNKPEEEYVRLHAYADVNLRDYAVIDRTFGPSDVVTNEFRHIFAFPPQEVKAGEYVRLHTGSGSGNGAYQRTVSSKKLVVHHFYWKSKACIWNNKGGDVATLLRYSAINSVTVPAI
ncbi:hypothetical protein [Hymenobacter coccineus]|uniref:hypothetical protein n=1 Tax=Hymenobacter coccineus TaxID=1908235 RepID=UPI000F79DB6C|nr:hypothetical protein [Hymenobacter coccineus]